MRRLLSLLCFVFFLAAQASIAMPPDTPGTLPDAPVPCAGQNIPVKDPASQRAETAGTPIHYASLYARTIFPGEVAQHLTVADKFIYSGRQMIEPLNLLTSLISAGESQWRDSDPKYGTDSGAFGQRLGAALIREDSDRLFTNAVFPALLHEDPRYYRLGSGTVTARTENALKQIFVARTDGGKKIPNYAGLIGRGLALGLTQAYYPDTSRGGGVVLRGFGTSLAGLGAFNILREFVPRDVFTHLTIFRTHVDETSLPAPK